MAWIRGLETDLNVVNATLNATRQEFHRKHDALTGMRFLALRTPTYLDLDTYQRLEDASIKMKQGIQKAWTKCKELQEENNALIGTYRFVHFNPWMI